MFPTLFGKGGGRTELSQDADIRFKGFTRVLSVLLGLVFKKKILSQAKAEFARLKELCEGDPDSR